MKKKMIIPIFIPHNGCKNDCVFCNQRRITACDRPPTIEEAVQAIKNYLSTKSSYTSASIAFYGGSFTGIPISEQKEYLDMALEFVASGSVENIHLSTRPDYINDEILTFLSGYPIELIELGCQSFSDKVLAATNRGHTASDIYTAIDLIKVYGFNFGIQLMIGLPESTPYDEIFSARCTVKLQPKTCRLYPTIVIPDTKLYDDTITGLYKPLSLDDAVLRCSKMYKIIAKGGIDIIRVGLKSSLTATGDPLLGNTFHPAFRQLVEGVIAYSDICQLIDSELKKNTYRLSDDRSPLLIQLFANSRSLPALVGHKGENRLKLSNRYPYAQFKFKTDTTLPQLTFKVIIGKL